MDEVTFIELNQGLKHIYVVTGDTGHGLTHGVLAGKLLVDEIQGIDNVWSKLSSPKRSPLLLSLPGMLTHDEQISI